MQEKVSLLIDQITLSPDGLNLLITLLPNNIDITVKSIVALLQHPSLPKFKLSLDGINEAITLHESIITEEMHNETGDKSVNEDDSVETDEQETKEPFKTIIEPIIVASKRDAELNIVISEDNMTAYAEIITAYGGQSITLSDIKQRCDQLGINFGLMPKSILTLVNTAKKYSMGKKIKVIIAKGREPIDGDDSSFVKLIETDNHRKPKPVMLENGKVDMHNLGKTIAIDVNTVLMEQIPATDGTPGKTITGLLIDQIKGISHPFGECKNVQVDPENPHFLRSTCHGIPIDEGEFIRIDDVLLLHDISVKTGNVDYDGTVIITGDVHEGMKIRASGDVTIMGVIESAEIYCGGDLTAKMPIIGRQKQDSTNYSCKIECKGNLTGTIAQYTHLTVGKDLMLDNQLMHCHTECKGAVLVYNESFSQGAIIGGITESNKQIVTTIVGTNAGNKTTIDLTGEYKRLFKDKKQQTLSVQEAEDGLQRIKKAELRAKALLDPDDRKLAVKKAIEDKQIMRDKSDAVQSDLKDTKQKITNYFATTNLTATKVLYSGVTVLIGKNNCVSGHGHGPSNVSMQDSEIKITAYQKN